MLILKTNERVVCYVLYRSVVYSFNHAYRKSVTHVGWYHLHTDSPFWLSVDKNTEYLSTLHRVGTVLLPSALLTHGRRNNELLAQHRSELRTCVGVNWRGREGSYPHSVTVENNELFWFLIWNNSKYEPISIIHSYLYIIREYFTSCTSNRASHVIRTIAGNPGFPNSYTHI
jgi:hypothetical protein